MKSSLVNYIDVAEIDETTHVAGSSNEAEVESTPSAQQDSIPRRNSRANESRYNQRNDHIYRTAVTSSNVVNFVDFNDIDPPSFSRQESIRVTAPRATLNRPHRRMIVDVDEFMDIENKDVSNHNSDESIPSAMPTPKRSASQNAAIKAVLGHDDFEDGYGNGSKKIDDKHSGVCSDSVAGNTVDMSEDEIAAIVAPDLQRQSGNHNSTPGAFSVPGCNDVAVPIASYRARASARRPYAVVNGHGDGTHMISATLVGNGACGSDLSQDAPILVYAERLWWKRRFVLCLSAWMLLVIAVISVSVTLSIRFSASSDENVEQIASNNSEVKSLPPPTKSPSKSPIDLSKLPSKSPIVLTLSPSAISPSPTLIIDPSGTMVSIHSVSWGVLTSCSEFNYEVQSYELILSCGGRIVLEKFDNVDCRTVRGFNNAIDPEKLICRLNSSKPYVDASTNDIYQQVTGLAMFSCRGTLTPELLATAEFVNVSVSSCLPSLSTLGTASSFVSLGRFCQNEDSLQFRDIVSNCGQSNKCIVLTPSQPICDIDSGDSFRKLNFIDDARDAIAAFCYELTSCSNQNATSDVCILNVPDIISENIATEFDICSNPGNDESNVDNMWNISQEKLNPLKRMDVIIRDIFL